MAKLHAILVIETSIYYKVAMGGHGQGLRVTGAGYWLQTSLLAQTGLSPTI